VWLRSRADLSRRRFVLFDRYPYEALLPPDGPLGLPSRLRRAALGRLLPPPHLVVFLDAPGAVLHARKREHSPERLERDRQGYLSLARGRRGWTVVDATQAADDVRRDVTGAIWQVYRRRIAGR
jgi:thymidylate kinase